MKIKHIITLLTSTILFGCKSFLEIDPPQNLQVPQAVFSTTETANSALLSVLGRMSGQLYTSPYWLSFLTGISGDELRNSLGTTDDIYVNAIDPKNSTTNQYWTAVYNTIYAANAIYEGCDKSTTLPTNVKKQLMAEAIFIRAYWHFTLVNLYGDIPIMINTDYSSNLNAKRETAVKVYEQVIADLKYAEENLSEDYVGPNGLSPVAERLRPNKAVARALLARIYLFTANYAKAESLATSLISNTSHYKLESLDNVFLKESKEAIWQVMPENNSSFNTYEGFNFILSAAPADEQKPFISDELIDAFELGDNRRTHWIGTFTDTNKDYFYPFKYKVRSSSEYTEYSVVFRLAEQYLIRAEARNEQGNTSGAIEDINLIRTRSRATDNTIPNPLPALAATLSKEAVNTAILHERQVELFTEQGHRWLDLKRTKTINVVMDRVTVIKGGTWNNNKQLWPIPYNDLLKGPNLKQNPGYE